MIKSAQELIVDPGGPPARDRVLDVLKKGLVLGAGAGIGAGAGTLATKYLSSMFSDEVKRKYLPPAIGMMGTGILLLEKARRDRADRMSQDALDKRMLLRVSGEDELGRVRDVIQQSVPEKNRFKVYLSHEEQPGGSFHREIVLQPGVSESRIRRAVWGE